jgi:hypothetical protein
MGSSLWFAAVAVLELFMLGLQILPSIFVGFGFRPAVVQDQEKYSSPSDFRRL